MLRAIALAASLGAHWVDWAGAGYSTQQKAVAIGAPKVDEHIILYFPDGTWRTMIVKSGHYGDDDKARRFVWKSKIIPGADHEKAVRHRLPDGALRPSVRR